MNLSGGRRPVESGYATTFSVLFDYARGRQWLIVCCFGMLVLGLALYGNGMRSLWYDEAYSFYTALNWRPLAQFQIESNMWLYYLTLSSWLSLGSGEGTMRALSALYAAAAVPVAYLLGRELFGARPALIAALLLAVNAFLVRYGQELRAYSLVITLSGLSTLFFVRVVLTRSRYAWIAYGLVTGLAVYAHYFMVLVPGVHMASLVLLPKQTVPWRSLLGAGGLAAVIALPLGLTFSVGTGNLDWVSPPQWRDLLHALRHLSGGGAILLVYLTFAVSWVIAQVNERPADAGRSDTHRLWRTGLLVLWWLGPPLLIFVISVAWRPIFVGRYFAICLFPSILLAACGVARLKGWMLAAGVALLVVLNLRALVDGSRDGAGDFNYRDAVASVVHRARDGDGIGVYFYDTWLPVNYYLQRYGVDRPLPTPVDLISARDLPRLPSIGENAAIRSEQPDAGALAGLPDRHPRFWLVLSLHDQDRRDPGRITDLLRQGYTLADAREFGGAVQLHLYERSEH